MQSIEVEWIAVPLKMSNFLRFETGSVPLFLVPILILYDPAEASMSYDPGSEYSKYSTPTLATKAPKPRLIPP